MLKNKLWIAAKKLQQRGLLFCHSREFSFTVKKDGFIFHSAGMQEQKECVEDLFGEMDKSRAP